MTRTYDWVRDKRDKLGLKKQKSKRLELRLKDRPLESENDLSQQERKVITTLKRTINCMTPS
jgi:hypothetical protein